VVVFLIIAFRLGKTIGHIFGHGIIAGFVILVIAFGVKTLFWGEKS
jgi:hypothetical protein